MLFGLYGGRYSFVALFALITGLCLWEFLNMTLTFTNKRRDYARRSIGVVFGLLPFVFISLLKLEMVTNPSDYSLISSLLFFPFIFLMFIYEMYANSENPFGNVAFIILGMIYIGIPFASLDFIAFDGPHFYANTVFGLLLLTWANDTLAYLVGSQIGKTPLFPRLSPKKTWEGSVGGGIITLLLAFALGYLMPELTHLDWLVLGGIVIIFGGLGDLVESMLKRSVGVKDSGTIMPGHGGLLDRFDAFIFLIPFATAYLLWIRG